MTIVSDRSGKISRTGAFLNRIKAIASKLVNPNELRAISRGELEQVARDLTLSIDELHALPRNNHRSGELLGARLAEFNLAPESVRTRHPEVLSDLQRVCSNCPVAKRCAAGFAREDRERRSEYCPNTQTLQALEQESLKPVTPAPLPIGPACC
jgi:hypothetical protein